MKIILLLLSTSLYAHTIHYYQNPPLKIITLGHPTLKKVAKEVKIDSIQTDQMQTLIDNMIDTMKDAGGVGLAAPQVNHSIRLFVMQPSSMKKAEAVINPMVSYVTELGMKNSREGCLSIPGKSFTVKRYKELKANYYNRDGEYVTEHAKGFRAIVFQHEYDHLNGNLISDTLFPVEIFNESYEFEADTPLM